MTAADASLETGNAPSSEFVETQKVCTRSEEETETCLHQDQRQELQIQMWMSRHLLHTTALSSLCPAHRPEVSLGAFLKCYQFENWKQRHQTLISCQRLFCPL